MRRLYPTLEPSPRLTLAAACDRRLLATRLGRANAAPDALRTCPRCGLVQYTVHDGKVLDGVAPVHGRPGRRGQGRP